MTAADLILSAVCELAGRLARAVLALILAPWVLALAVASDLLEVVEADR